MREKHYTERAIDALRHVPWAARLIREAADLLQPLSQSARSQAKMGQLLEVRFSYHSTAQGTPPSTSARPAWAARRSTSVSQEGPNGLLRL